MSTSWKTKGIQILLIAHLVGYATSSLSEQEFSALVSKLHRTIPGLTAQQYKLLFDKVTYTEWRSPNSINGPSPELNVTFNVVIYQIPPFVMINNFDGPDPGNAMQTRTDKAGLSGLTIDILKKIKDTMGININYYYPCDMLNYNKTSKCAEYDKATAAKQMISTGTAGPFYGPKSLCNSVNDCFGAGAFKLSSDLTSNFFVTQPYMEKGFLLFTMSQPQASGPFSWAASFDYIVWILIGAEIVLAGIVLIVIEGYTNNETLTRNPFMLVLDTFYWSFTLVLGVQDHQPVTNAGRTLVLAQLFFALLLKSIFTGNLNSILLQTPTTTSIKSIDEFIKSTNPSISLCLPTLQNSTSTFIQQSESIYGSTITKHYEKDVSSCLMNVYQGKSTATFYDDSVISYKVNNEFWQMGMCGNSGGYCSQPGLTQDTCKCDSSATSCNITFTSVQGSLVSVGDIFGSFGYTFIFPLSSTQMHQLQFSQVIQYLKETGDISAIESNWIAGSFNCAGSTGNSTALGLYNMLGLIIFVSVWAFVGLGVGIFESMIKFFISLCKGTKRRRASRFAPTSDDEAVVNIKDGGGAADATANGDRDETPGTPTRAKEVELPPDLSGLPTKETLMELEARLDRIEERLEDLLSPHEDKGAVGEAHHKGLNGNGTSSGEQQDFDLLGSWKN